MQRPAGIVQILGGDKTAPGKRVVARGKYHNLAVEQRRDPACRYLRGDPRRAKHNIDDAIAKRREEDRVEFARIEGQFQERATRRREKLGLPKDWTPTTETGSAGSGAEGESKVEGDGEDESGGNGVDVAAVADDGADEGNADEVLDALDA